MKVFRWTIIGMAIALLSAGTAPAQELMIYPAKGQSNEQLDKDKYECYAWAKKQTGFDPMQQPAATEPPPQQQAQAEQQWAQQQAATYTKNRDGYDRAYGACLEGRGYSVK